MKQALLESLLSEVTFERVGSAIYNDSVSGRAAGVTPEHAPSAHSAIQPEYQAKADRISARLAKKTGAGPGKVADQLAAGITRAANTPKLKHRVAQAMKKAVSTAVK